MGNITMEERQRRARAAMGGDVSNETASPATAPDTAGRTNRFEMHPDDLPRRTRRSTLGQVGMDTDLPAHLQRPGWVYAWFPRTVYNEPVETWQITAVADGGWEEVPSQHILDDQRKHPGERTLIPQSYANEFVERGGQVLYMRPYYLEEQSRAEDLKRAQMQSQGRLESAQIDNIKGSMYQRKSQDEVFVRPGLSGQGASMLEAEAQRNRADRAASRRSENALNADRQITSADDISAEERAEIANRHRGADGRVTLG